MDRKEYERALHELSEGFQSRNKALDTVCQDIKTRMRLGRRHLGSMVRGVHQDDCR